MQVLYITCTSDSISPVSIASFCYKSRDHTLRFHRIRLRGVLSPFSFEVRSSPSVTSIQSSLVSQLVSDYFLFLLRLGDSLISWGF